MALKQARFLCFVCAGFSLAQLMTHRSILAAFFLTPCIATGIYLSFLCDRTEKRKGKILAREEQQARLEMAIRRHEYEINFIHDEPGMYDGQ